MQVEVHVEQDGVRFCLTLTTLSVETHSRMQQLRNDDFGTIKNILRSAGASIRLEIVEKTKLKV